MTTTMAKCAVTNCLKPLGNRKHFCEMHYRRWLRHGNEHTVGKRGRKFKQAEGVTQN
jgi:hypothetical protein